MDGDAGIAVGTPNKMLCLSLLIATSGLAHVAGQPVAPPQVIWTGYGGNAQHTAVSGYSPAGYNQVVWSASLDASPPYSGGILYIHYGSSSLTADTIITPYRNSSNFQFIGRSIISGHVLWNYASSYQLPAPGGDNGWDWVPPVSGTLLPDGSYAGPMAGAGVFIRGNSDSSSEPVNSFYPFPSGAAAQQYLNSLYTVTPITADSQGNMYYGMRAYATLPHGLSNAFLKVSEKGKFTIFECETNRKPAFNAAPALSPDGSTLYVVENVAGSYESHVIALSTATMTKTADVIMVDPWGNDQWAIPDSTASPLVGPDGDVYFGGMYGYYDRGWLLHFDKNLNPKGVEGSFGWDDTASIVPSSAVPSYHGSSSYLICCKYNHYGGTGPGQTYNGYTALSGNNCVAILDPNASAIDPYTGVATMQPVLQVLGVTPDPDNDQTYPGAVREWCINSAAVDPAGKSIVLNSEDGNVYKWDLTKATAPTGSLAQNVATGTLMGTLTSHLKLTDGIGEAYTPTIIGKNGTIFAVDNATVYAVSTAHSSFADNSRPRAARKAVAKR